MSYLRSRQRTFSSVFFRQIFGGGLCEGSYICHLSRASREQRQLLAPALTCPRPTSLILSWLPRSYMICSLVLVLLVVGPCRAQPLYFDSKSTMLSQRDKGSVTLQRWNLGTLFAFLVLNCRYFERSANRGYSRDR